MIYLIDYDWRGEHLVDMQVFEDLQRPAAEAARRDRELRLLNERLDREIVLLEALDEEGLRRTHTRYFKSLEELLAQAVHD
jgi:hypothetical protein